MHLMNVVVQVNDLVPDVYKKWFWFGAGCVYILIVSVASFFNPDGTSAKVGYESKNKDEHF